MQNNFNDLINLDITNERINRLIDDVISGIQEDWPVIYKIRYKFISS